MQVVCISRGTLTGGRQLAEKLAANLGYDCLSREELTDSATKAGIPVGQLEMAVVGRRPLSDQMAIHKERFKAWVTATLCERALENGLVYHGRTGHLQLPGVANVLRVRTIMDPEMRVELTMQRLGLNREKARKYNEQVDEDRHRWARIMYNLDWEDPAQYDVLLNLSHLGAGNAASALVSMAQLPEFQPTPATRRVLQDLLLAARCRLAIGEDQRTRRMDVKVKAEKGSLLVTYLPRDQGAVTFVQEVLKGIAGVDQVVCTMASTNLLWIQEVFDATAQSFSQVLDIAGKWNAAVELVQLKEQDTASDSPPRDTRAEAVTPATGDETESEYHGGILDEDARIEEVSPDEGVNQAVAQLISAGRAGGFRAVRGGPKELVASMDRTVPYSLIIVGDVFLNKGEAVRKRLSTELVSYLSDSLSVPVISGFDLTARFLFGSREWMKLFGFAAFAALLFALVFTNQREILAFLHREGTTNGILRAAVLFAFVPIFAFAYGSFTRYLLRLFRFE